MMTPDKNSDVSVNNKKIQICFVNKFDWLGAAPMGTVSVMMCNALATIGHKVTLYIGGEPDPNPHLTLKNKYGMEPLSNFNLHVIPKSIIKRFSKFAFNLYIRASLHIIRNRKKNEHLIIISRNTNFLPFLWLLKKVSGASVYFESHSFHNRARGERSFMGIAPDSKALQPWLLERFILPHINGIVCMAKNQSRLYNAVLPKLPSIVLPLGSPAPTEAAMNPTLKQNQRKLVYCGRFTDHIDVETIMEALAQYKNSGTTFTWFGLPDIDKEKLRKLSQKYGVQDTVFPEGWISHNDLQNRMSNEYGIGLATYKKDYITSVLASPTKIFDYYAAGLPVIASRINSVTDIMKNEQEGLVYKPGDSVSLLECIRRITENPGFYENLRANCIKSAAFFSWENRAKRFVEFARKNHN